VNSGASLHALEVSDADLLARVAAGDNAALGIVYDRHRRAVTRFAARISGKPQDAEDITHETFLTVSKIAGAYDGRPSCRPWLLGIAARTLSHRQRGAARLARFLTRLGRLNRNARSDPGPALAARSELRCIQLALPVLSEVKRVVLVMFEIEEMSGEEIAIALGVPVGTVWTRLHAARRELRARLEASR
jgi:RNA polymerase sigma-70 factor (ECF subfamily)